MIDKRDVRTYRTTYLDLATDEELREVAKRRGIYVAGLVRLYIEEGLRREKRKGTKNA